MKTHHLKRLCLLGLSAASFAFAPVAIAQVNPASPPSSSNSKVDDNSQANQNSSTTGTAPDPGAVGRTDSKDTTGALDKNPSNASTDSADKSATKDPTGDTAPGTADKNEATTGTTHHSSVSSDKAFLMKAAQGGMTEVQLGQLAQEKASSSDVKKFGSHMAADHANANAQLQTLAQQKGITVPDKLDAKHQATIDHFKTLSGPAFDKAYVNAMVKDHQKTVSDFETESTKGTDADVKDFATKTLPTIKEHLTEVQGLQSKL